LLLSVVVELEDEDVVDDVVEVDEVESPDFLVFFDFGFFAVVSVELWVVDDCVVEDDCEPTDVADGDFLTGFFSVVDV
jgi:hypothetical protein